MPNPVPQAPLPFSPIPRAEYLEYKRIGDVHLHLNLFRPKETQATGAAIVFFFGGGWQGGSPLQFQHQCRYFAQRGLLAIAAEYRVASLHGTSPFESVADGKSAIRWIRTHAAEWGVDSDRIVGSGGSAGAHVAVCAACVRSFDEPREDSSVSSRPDALVLFNPVLDLSGIGPLQDRFLGRALEASPLHHLDPSCPPTLILHGTDDTTVPIQTAEAFTRRMKELGRHCELAAFPGEKHGFFNYPAYPDHHTFAETVSRADQFLIELGLLTGQPDLERFLTTG